MNNKIVLQFRRYCVIGDVFTAKYLKLDNKSIEIKWKQPDEKVVLNKNNSFQEE